MDIMTRIENEFRKLHRILMGVVVISMLSFIMLQFHRESHIFADTSICDQNYGNASAPSSFCSPQNRQDLNQNPLKPTRPHSIKKERSNLRISWVPYGQFNNNLMIFARMCLLAERTGRKLLVPRDFGQQFLTTFSVNPGSPLSTFFFTNRKNETDEQDAIADAMTLKQFEQSAIHLSWDRDVLERDQRHQPPRRTYFLRNLTQTHMTIGKQESLPFWHSIVNRLRPRSTLLPAYVHQRDWYFTWPFFTPVRKHDYLHSLRTFFDFSPDIQREGRDRIRTWFQDRPFVGIHLRYLDGLCDGWMHETFGPTPYLTDALEQCSMHPNYIMNILNQHQLDPNTTYLYLASDRQRPELDEALQRTFPHTLKTQWDSPRGLDMYILSESTLFIGNPMSTLSTNVVLIRESKGHSWNSTVMAGYQEAHILTQFII